MKSQSTREGVALLLSPTILMAFAFFMLIPMSFGAIRVFSVSALVDLYDYSLIDANVVLTGFLAGTAAGILVGGLFVDRVKRPEMMAGGGFLGGALFVVVVGALPLPYVLVIAAIAVAGFCAGVVQPARDLLVRQITPEGSAGKVFGFVSTGIGCRRCDHGRWFFGFSCLIRAIPGGFSGLPVGFSSLLWSPSAGLARPANGSGKPVNRASVSGQKETALPSGSAAPLRLTSAYSAAIKRSSGKPPMS